MIMICFSPAARGPAWGVCYRSVTEGANSSPYIADVLYAKKNLAMCAVAKVIGASVRSVNIRRACGATAGIRAGIGQAVDAITYSNTGDRLYARPIQTSVHGSPIVSNPPQCSIRTTATQSGPSGLRGAAKVTGSGGKAQRVPGRAEKSFSPSSRHA